MLLQSPSASRILVPNVVNICGEKTNSNAIQLPGRDNLDQGFLVMFLQGIETPSLLEVTAFLLLFLMLCFVLFLRIQPRLTLYFNSNPPPSAVQGLGC